MNFPGDNTITLTRETVHEIVRTYVAQLIGDKARVTTLRGDGYSSIPAIVATFTTDQAPAPEPAQ